MRRRVVPRGYRWSRPQAHDFLKPAGHSWRLPILKGRTMSLPNAGGRPHRVVVIGGGFAGLQTVRALRRAPVEVTLVDRRNFHLFQPLLYQVATGALTAGEIASPLRGLLKGQRNARVVLGEVRGFDLEQRRALGAF